MIYDWVKEGQEYDDNARSFPALEKRIHDYLRILEIASPDYQDQNTREFMERVVEWDVEEKRQDEIRFTNIARSHIKKAIDECMMRQPLRLMWFQPVTNQIESLDKNKDANDSWGGVSNSEYPGIFFPANNKHPYTLDALSGFAFSSGKYKNKYTVESTDEEMTCFEVDMSNSVSAEVPKITKLEKFKGNHLTEILPQFKKMLREAHEYEIKNMMPFWGSERQSVFKGLLQHRYDGMPWQYRFASIIYGLGLEDREDELYEYMEKRIQKGQVSQKRLEDWYMSRYHDDVGKDKRLPTSIESWRNNETNRLPPILLNDIREKVKALPDRLFPAYFHSVTNKDSEWELFLGPDLYSVVREKMDTIEQKRFVKNADTTSNTENNSLTFAERFIEVWETMYMATPERARDILFFIPNSILTVIASIKEAVDYYQR